MSEMARGALISPCERYRYFLYRSWADGPFVTFLMFNPSRLQTVIEELADMEAENAALRAQLEEARTKALAEALEAVSGLDATERAQDAIRALAAPPAEGKTL